MKKGKKIVIGVAAVAVVALTYKWKHNTLVSIAVGTAGYMILLRLMAM